jgi:hypothetical protein
MLDLKNLKKELDSSVERNFEYLIEKEFLNDLKNVNKLNMIDPVDMIPSQNFLLTLLKKKYIPNKGCPSAMYDTASKDLQSGYDRIHNEICEILHNHLK